MATTSSNNTTHMKHGFICPECLRKFRTQELLLSHFDEHTNRQKTTIKTTPTDLLARLTAATRRKPINSAEQLDITDIDESRYKGKHFIQQSMVVPAGVTRSHIDDLKEIRRERLDHRISEANMLITRLDRLLRCEEADRKQAAAELVLWVDGKVVSRCPNCTQKFNVISRRQHHCRLCGSVMCNNSTCSAFLTYNQAREIAGPLDLNQSARTTDDPSTTEERIRLCTYCWDVLESRRRLQINQHMKPPVFELYDQLVHLKQDIQTSANIYHDMHGSLTAGETVHMLQDAQSIHSSIAQKAEVINAVSQKIASLQPAPINSVLAAQLHHSIRQATSHYIKEHLATLPALPTPQQMEKIKAQVASDNGVAGDVDRVVSAVRKVVVTTGWNGENAAAAANVSDNPGNEDPLIQQINIVREYIRQAREALRYEEVATLKENLTVLKRQYQFQLEQEQQLANKCQHETS